MGAEAGNNTGRAGMMSGVHSCVKAAIRSLASRLRSLRILPTRLHGGTPGYATGIAVFNTSVDDLISQGRFGDKVYFKSPGCKRGAICEVGWADKERFSLSWRPTELEVRVKLPCKDSFRRIFEGRTIEIPTSWELDYFKRGKWARFRVGKEYAKTIGPFLDAVFKQIYGRPDDYAVDAYIPPDYGHFV